MRLWALLGFAQVADDEVVFTQADVDALRAAQDLVELGILSAERQEALVRTWGRSFARLADWQTSLLATVALESGADLDESMAALASEVVPRVEALQSYVWRRHLVSAGARRLTSADPTSSGSAPLTVVFVDIVGYTSRSKSLTEHELVEWIERFESETTALVAAQGGRIIKNIGDEVLFVADDTRAALDAALELCRRGSGADDPFPEVRAGLAHGETVRRLGDVYGETVNIAARLTSVARPGTVLVDRGAYEALTGTSEDDDVHHPDFQFRRLKRLSVKGYSRLAAWAVRPRT
ncbi:adenylate/guanylate cyclase domain-containing protein [Nocardioides rubriscoriae]|uniref:adenylate/guanylate cyclase domain-containing protein n=1 Tax=Nocardioides rubriscoriae TaxID=642762 RepID=UPI001FE560A2|nr:adenylate/guanylate cyclase domain-containing protein [Nocardioides rubriscoriae]